MTEPHWPADGSGDEDDGGYDPTAYGTVRPTADELMAMPVDELAAWVRASGLKTVSDLSPSDTYYPGDYESPHTAPFVQVRVNGELVPGHIVYPWPDGGLVVEPLEA